MALVKNQCEAQVFEDRDSQDEEDEENDNVSIGGVSAEPIVCNPNKRWNLADHITNQRKTNEK